MGVSVKPCRSSACRIAATRPSIISLGATTSAPASAWLNGGAGQQRQCRIIVHSPALVPPDDAAMAVAHVFAQADICKHQQFGQFLLQQPRRLLHDAVGRISARSLFILPFGNPEQNHPRHPRRLRRRRFPDHLVRRQLKDPRHGRDRLRAPFGRRARTTAKPTGRPAARSPAPGGATPPTAATVAGDIGETAQAQQNS